MNSLYDIWFNADSNLLEHALFIDQTLQALITQLSQHELFLISLILTYNNYIGKWGFGTKWCTFYSAFM